MSLDAWEKLAKEALARANAAMEGPWDGHPNGTSAWCGDKMIAKACRVDEQAILDMDFISYAREDVPALAAALREATAENAVRRLAGRPLR